MQKRMKSIKKEKKSYREPSLKKIAGIQELTKGSGNINADNLNGSFPTPISQN